MPFYSLPKNERSDLVATISNNILHELIINGEHFYNSKFVNLK